MSKKSRNTLKDVTNFIQQKPSTLVDVKKPHRVPEVEPDISHITSADDLVYAIRHYCEQQGLAVYPLILEIAEEILATGDLKEKTADEIMFLNTVTYLRIKGS
jgi:hypothetical protein